ncbi:branched-chain amino acid transport system II carrier protein, partial [Staphylococcus epidermidis]|uniref:branched-chain amino acid transport system II carrier protein n=1 Tax=Staphylococcus epidermidis TaxID=1282 RepID=UPI0021B48FE5
MLFFRLPSLFSPKPSKILHYIPKFLNPLFLIFLPILLLLPFIPPIPPITHPPLTPHYTNILLLKPFIHPYNTLHPFASLPFPIIILTTIKNFPITN